MSALKPLAQPPTARSKLADRLRDIARARSDLDVARVQFIGLEEVRRACQANWPEKREKIRDLASKFLAKRLDASDVLIPGAEGFVIVFGELEGDAAASASLSLSHRLSQFLIGEFQHGDTLRTQAETSKVGVAELAHSLGSIEYLDAQDPSSGPPTAIDWSFQPIWDCRREVISSYYSVPMDRSNGEPVRGYQFEQENLSPAPFVDIDEEALNVSEQAIKSLLTANKKALVGVSVHVQGLVKESSRTRILAALRGLDPKLARYRLVKVSAVPPGFPRMYLDDIMGWLRRYAPNIVLCGSPDEPELRSLLHAELKGIGVALSSDSGWQARAAFVLERIKAAVQIAHAAKLPFFVEGPVTRDMAVRLTAVGVDMLSSTQIWPLRTSPDGVMKWTADRLLAG